jgi:membrane protein DedA with SNARE-associated domain
LSLETVGWYCSIYLWLLFTGIGIPPCPEEAGILYAAGLSAIHPEVRWYLAWPLTMAGIVSADTVLYGIGWLWGPRLFQYRWVNRLIKPERRQRLEETFHGHGLKLLLTARLLPPLRTGVFIIAGAIRFSFVRFLLADACFAVIGVGVLFFGGQGLIALIKEAGHWGVYLAAGAVGLYGLYRYYRYLRRRELKVAPPPASILELPAGPKVEAKV